MLERTLQKLEFDKLLEKLQAHCTCSLGREKAEALLPSIQLPVIINWQQETSEAKEILRRDPLLPLGGIWDIRAALWKAEMGGILDPSELLQVSSTLAVSRRLKHFLLGRTAPETIIGQLAGQLGIFHELEKKVEECISDEAEVKDSASPTLLRLRRQLAVLQSRVREKLDSILRQTELQKYLQEAIITMRGDRYVVPVKQEYRHQVPGIIHDQSASGATVYIEPMVVVQINNEIRRQQAEEREEVRRILRELTGQVGAQTIEIRETLDGLAQLDFAFAKAKLSHEQDGLEPVLNNAGWLDIHLGRHPLISGRVVPLSVSLGKDFNTLVVTGPNTGGKTVALKTIGLLTLMAQAGLHVPADQGTCLSVFEQIFVDIGDEQSIEQSLSTFSSHMTNIVEILQQVNERSLVLLDELGAGTDPTEGAALAIAILEHLLAQGARTVATTHYSELKVFAYNQAQVENASVEFNADTLQPTYRLQLGLPGKSNAFEIAARLGLQASIVEAARGYLSAEELQVGDLIQDLKESQRKSEENQRETEKLRQMQEREEAELRRRQSAWQEKETRLLQRAQEEAIEIVRQARNEADQIVRQLRQMQKEAVDKETLRRAQEAQERLRDRASQLYEAWTKVSDEVNERLGLVEPEEHTALSDNGQPKIASDQAKKARKRLGQFKPGDPVLIPRLNQRGYVLTADSATGEVQVQAGILKVTVKAAELRPVQEKTEYRDYSGLGNLMASKSREISPEVHLRGMLVDEALIELEKYLDDAYLAGMAEVRVIHGKGTGTLRSAVKQYLANHPHVSSFRLGGYQEGGIGVTVVQLKSG
ncbi:MAG: endonuclease MutS2 [Bacillota bacterium]